MKLVNLNEARSNSQECLTHFGDYFFLTRLLNMEGNIDEGTRISD